MSQSTPPRRTPPIVEVIGVLLLIGGVTGLIVITVDTGQWGIAVCMVAIALGIALGTRANRPRPS